MLQRFYHYNTPNFIGNWVLEIRNFIVMQRFQVPQFITVEDKVIGPFTIKQFIYIAAGAILVAGIFFTFTGFLALMLSFLVGAIAVSLAFMKINGQSVPAVVKNAFLYFIRPRIFVWKRTKRKDAIEVTPASETPGESALPKSSALSHSRLSELSWTLDTKTHDELERKNKYT